MSLDLNRQTWGIHDHATPDEKQRATLYVASQARDAADCRQLLDVLGLLPKHVVAEHGMRGYRQGCRCPLCRKANTERTYRQKTKRTGEPATTTADCPINTKGDL
ncbi:hypothetical protein [Streptomyces cupreus]|uniref:Uncharacterized protein n=1 Tax=Streptomyces cupreus TaxID=2759956 RepID=A0A7X1J2V9_9ACTN|nr:hypothetical protein [Streptomyces cupreus]MBC2903195.1 hypothetical protein [Streptomyces cupreus]